MNEQTMTESISPAYFRSVTELAKVRGAETGAAAAPAPLPPITNRGVSPSVYDALETVEVRSSGTSKPFFIRIPKPDQKAHIRYSFIDYLNFTVKCSHFLGLGISDHDIVAQVSIHLQDIFGYGVTRKRPNGLNFYRDSYDLGINGWGTVCIGGQNDTCLVTVKGQGLLAAKPEWEKRLYDFLNQHEDSKLTRVDLAHDNFESAKQVDDYLSMYHAGLFTQRGQTPNVEQAGNWINPNGKGRTLYIGSRSSGKLLRVYEKGLHLAAGFTALFPNWLRVELELSCKQRVIPFEVLLQPGQYLAGAYPALKPLFKVQEVIQTVKKTAQITVNRAVEVTRHQFGRYIWTFVELFGADEAIKRLTAQCEQLPKKLDMGNYHLFDSGQNISPSPSTEVILI